TYMTNNAMRKPEEHGTVLAAAGYPVPAGSILTSPMAATALLAERIVAGEPVLVVGEDALRDAVRGAGYQVVDEGPAAAVVVGNRAETDVLMARRRRWRSTLVLTGVVTPADMATVWPFPDAVADDLAAALALGLPAPLLASDGHAVAAAGGQRWEACIDGLTM